MSKNTNVDSKSVEVCVVPVFLTSEDNFERFVGYDAVGGYCQDNGKCAFVNRKAQGSNAFFSEYAGKGLHSSVEKGAIFMWAIAVDHSLAW